MSPYIYIHTHTHTHTHTHIPKKCDWFWRIHTNYSNLRGFLKHIPSDNFPCDIYPVSPIICYLNSPYVESHQITVYCQFKLYIFFGLEAVYLCASMSLYAYKMIYTDHFIPIKPIPLWIRSGLLLKAWSRKTVLLVQFIKIINSHEMRVARVQKA